jgi:hypothetical protein
MMPMFLCNLASKPILMRRKRLSGGVSDFQTVAALVES